MSESMVGSSSEEIPNIRVEDAPSRDEALIQSRNRGATEMMLTFRPRSGSESMRAGADNSEESRYHFTSPSDGIVSQAFPTNTVVHLTPMERGHHRGTQDQEGMPKYEITQTGLKFKGNVKGIKFVTTQVASKGEQYTSERHVFEAGKQKQQSQGQEKQDSGFVKQSGALFLQSFTGSQAEVNQSAGGKDLFKVEQEAVEVEGETIECSFPVISQRVW